MQIKLYFISFFETLGCVLLYESATRLLQEQVKEDERRKNLFDEH